jgi:outer membrane receptor protein involved in Fe transport
MNLKRFLLAGGAIVAFAPLTAFAQTAPAPEPAATPPAAATTTTKEAPETVIVSATRRNVAANRIPYNITVQTGDMLRADNITDAKKLIADSVAINAPQNSARFNDSTTVRGLNISRVDANNLQQFIRSTLSYYLDDTPLPFMNYRIKDVARVETLLGPQGTLYGAGSLGGTVRYITNKPKLGEYEGAINTSVYQTRHGGVSTDVDLMLNVPIGETFAARLSIARLDEAGYTDRISNPPWRTGAGAWTPSPNPTQNVYKDDDWQEVTGGRLSLLWKPTDKFSIMLAHTRQDQLAHGTSGTSLLPFNIANARNDVELRAGWQTPFAAAPCEATNNCRYPNEFETPAVADHTIISRYEEFADRKLELSSLEFNYDFGFATLASSTSIYEDSSVGQADYASQGAIFYHQLFFDLGIPQFELGGDPASNRSAYMTFDNGFEGLSHETRLVSAGDGRLDWILGFYHTRQERSYKFQEVLPGMDAYLGPFKVTPTAQRDLGYEEDLASDYTETAVFGELGYQITDRWKVSGSARIFNYEDEANILVIDYAGGAVDNRVNDKRGDDGKAYIRVNTSFDVTPDLLAYATFSQGFRRGGTNGFKNVGSRVIAPTAAAYEPDSTNNYEVGLKGVTLDGRLYVAAALFQIDWKDPQTYRSQDVAGFPVNGTANGPDARSRGFEFNGRFRLTENWSIAYATAYTTAEFVETRTHCLYTNNTSCRTWNKGDVLGGTPDWKHNFSLRYQKDLDDGSRLYGVLSGRRLGEVISDRCDTTSVGTCDDVLRYPAYTRLNFSAGLSRGPWDLGFWVQNLTDEDVIVSNQPGGIVGRRVIRLTPRTFGLNLSYRWD